MRASATRLPLARKDHLVVCELPDEILIYDTEGERAHCLNRSSALVWKHCDDQTSVAEMTTLLSKEFDTPFAEEVVLLALRQFREFKLLEQSTSPYRQKRISRRQLVQRLGLAAAVLPVIVSISTPSPVSAASCLPLGSSCSSSSECCSSCCSEDVMGNTCQPISVCQPPKSSGS